MGAIQRDLEEITSEKADEIAEKRYGREFKDLPASLQMQTWMEAEQETKEYFACQDDRLLNSMMEEKLLSGGNSHKSKEECK